jgi:hypothetical protein
MNIDVWKDKAREQQQNFSIEHQDVCWEEYDIKNNAEQLRQRISNVLFGPFKSKFRSKEKSQLVNEISDKCMKHGSNGKVKVGFLLVSSYKQGADWSSSKITPIFRVLKSSSSDGFSQDAYLIDHEGRVYKKWRSFLSKNTFDQSWICVCANGAWESSTQLDIEFYDQSNRGKYLNWLDRASIVSNILFGLTMLSGLIIKSLSPLATAFNLIGSVGGFLGSIATIYATLRSIIRLVDRARHDQKLSLRQADARICWMSIVGSVFSLLNFITPRVIEISAVAGGSIETNVRYLCTSLSGATGFVNILEIINSFVQLARKRKKSTVFDIMRFTKGIFLLIALF